MTYPVGKPATGLVYLAGPMTGLTLEQAVEWRRIASNILQPWGIETLSPCRQVQQKGVMPATGWGDTPLETARGLTTCDRMDVSRSNALLVNLLGATKVSVGTMIELGWADARRLPIFLVMEREGNPHEHAMVRELADFHFTNVEDAAHAVRLQFNRGPNS